MRGIKFNITDTMIHQDPAHQRGAQVAPVSRRLFHRLELHGRLALEEPILMCEIKAPG